jgi:hypothetical protein
MDNSSFVSGAVVTSGGLEVTAGGQMQVATSGVTTTKIANLNVTTEKIADGAVTPAKLSTAGPSWDSAGGTFTLSQRAVELGNGITSNAASYIDFHSSFPIIDNDARIIRESGANGTLTISNIGTGSINFSSSGGFQFASAPMPNPSGSAPIFGVRAWVNFVGRSTNGNCTIRGSGNVNSVVRTAAGKYTINFATPMPGVNYAVICNSGSSPGDPRWACADRTSVTTSSVKIETDNASGAGDDFNENNVMIIV